MKPFDLRVRRNGRCRGGLRGWRGKHIDMGKRYENGIQRSALSPTANYPLPFSRIALLIIWRNILLQALCNITRNYFCPDWFRQIAMILRNLHDRYAIKILNRILSLQGESSEYIHIFLNYDISEWRDKLWDKLVYILNIISMVIFFLIPPFFNQFEIYWSNNTWTTILNFLVW